MAAIDVSQPELFRSDTPMNLAKLKASIRERAAHILDERVQSRFVKGYSSMPVRLQPC